MKPALKIVLHSTVLMVLALPTLAFAGILSKVEAQCQCLTEHASLGQLISLGVMLTLVTGVIALKWIYRDEFDQAVTKEKSEAEHSAVQTLNELKMGTRFWIGVMFAD
jgi:hypothetical protein